jgi:hypothetical protein
MPSRSERDQLIKAIRSVRRRWRLRVTVRGAAIVLGTGLIVFLVSAYGMDRSHFSPTAVLAFRIFAYVALVGVAVRFLILPLARRVSDERIALYLEEHEPSLEAQLLSAIEFGRTEGDTSRDFSPALVERLVRNAAEQCRLIDFGRRVEAKSLVRSSGLLVGVTMLSAVVLLISPPFLRHGTPYLVPLGGGQPDNPYRIEVTPGNTRVAKGAEVEIAARLFNFDSDQVEIAVQRTRQGEWERYPMTLEEETGEYLFFLLDLDDESEYFVEASGIRSPLYRIDVAELPYVERMTLEYNFPAYTGLSPLLQEDGGDIAAVKGTEVRLLISPTLPVTGGAIVVENRDTLPLTVLEDGTLTAELRVSENGLYRVAFESFAGDQVVGSPDYLIDVLPDQPPIVSFSKPGRDVNVTSIEEVFVEVEAEDDYGVTRLELFYSVNGGAEQTQELYSGRRRDIKAGHTLYLEELDLVPGDFISYWARVTDGNRVSGQQEATTDIYFMEVRPYDREFRQADQGGGAGGAGGGFDSSLSQRQRDVIAATFKMVRDRGSYSSDEYGENLATLALAQGRLREQVERLVAQIEARGIVHLDSTFQAIIEELPKAAEAMGEAEGLLGERNPDDALSPEQRALQHLQRAEAEFREVQVGRGMPSAGSGGGGQPDMEELAELFELELDKQRNQYEQVQRGRQEQVDDQIDETLQKLQELARRQQQENERLRAQAGDAQRQAGSGGGQRRLAEEAEELARRLERLSREESRSELNETARQLRRAAEEMRRAAANRRSGGVSEGISALERLKEARRLLDENRSASLEREVDDALRRAERLAEEQREVQDDVERLGRPDASHSERLRRLMERKDEMADEVEDLEAQLDRLARDSRREQRDASRRLQEAADAIRDDKLEDKIRYSRGVVQQRAPEYARNFEEQIAKDIEGLQEKISDARDAIGETEEQRLARTLDRTRDLVRSLESLEERTLRRAGEEQRRESDAAGQGQSAERAEGGERRGEARESADATADGFPGFSPGEVRQFRREFRERRGEAERLRDQLAREGMETAQLDAIVSRLRDLERERPYGDPRALSELQAQVIQDLKEYEFGLLRELGGGDSRQLMLTGSDDVPPGYRILVEEYYRTLAEQGSEKR